MKGKKNRTLRPVRILSEEEAGNYKVRFISMHGSIHGFITEGPAGFYNIYINDRLSRVQQRNAFLHEYAHYINGDLDSSEPIEDIEARACGMEAGHA